ncbi:hypothetical protein Csa_010430 [Cucumis sativus]|uniref:Secreted protein n=1 Tax=Cucumis sativus TaxID=3659 RepID=A0A0A0L2H4_CUCSA|nr:hypothetical protein Csa_010430 [Cucumis sativus]
MSNDDQHAMSATLLVILQLSVVVSHHQLRNRRPNQCLMKSLLVDLVSDLPSRAQFAQSRCVAPYYQLAFDFK